MDSSNTTTHHMALVTGASSGIGREFARQLAEMGHNVLLVSNQERELAETTTELSALHPQGLFPTYFIDLSRHDTDTILLDFCHSNGYEIDILVNNAGIFSFRAVTDTPPERIDLFIDLHTRAVTRICRTFALDMKRRQCHGHILNMSSMSCWMPMPGIAMYSATKAYIRVFSRSLNVELADDGITVMAACPGGIATDLFGLPQRLQRLGVRIGVLATPQSFVHGALKRLFKCRHQYINGLINRIAIVAVALLPDRLRLIVKHRLLDRLSTSPSTGNTTL